MMKVMHALIIILTLIISLVSLFYSFNNKDIADLDLDKLISLLGIIITAIAFALGAYFVLVAVSAYAHARDIEKTKDSVEKNSTEISKYLDEIRSQGNYIFINMVNMLDDFLGHQVSCFSDSFFSSLSTKYKRANERRLRDLMQIRGRLALKYPYFEKIRRMNLIRELTELGDTSDLRLLEELATNEDDRELSALARVVIRKIYEKVDLRV